MPDDNTKPTPVNPPADDNAATPSAVPSASPSEIPAIPSIPTAPDPAITDSGEAEDIKSKVAHAIADSQNVLVALSSDPSVDEMAAAIGLSLYLDRLGKRATAIYSGSTPNALEFLKPEDTFEPSADTLQDFVVALNKEKADHVRCKVDGDFVKLYITPYRTKVSEDDLEFSYGDYNVDLVLALDVANGIDLDSALREHGRIMHDASIINITTGNPGKFGEIEWSDKGASSVSEMLADLIITMNAKEKLSGEEATAFLTGIVAATDRFSTAATTSKTMNVASKLMEAGANQQLISQNITDDIENEMFGVSSLVKADSEKDDTTNIEIDHEVDEGSPKENKDAIEGDHKETSDSKEDKSAKDDSSQEESGGMSQESSLLADLQKAAASLAQAGDETVPVPGSEPIKIDSTESSSDLFKPTDREESPAVTLGKEAFETKEEDQRDYNKMLEEALGNASAPSVSEPTPVPEPTATPELTPIPESASALESISTPVPTQEPMSTSTLVSTQPTEPEFNNPAAMSAPQVSSTPEINEVPEINYAPSLDSAILPPPPVPPVNENMFTPTEDFMNTSAPMPDLSSIPEPPMPSGETTPVDLPEEQPLNQPVEPAPSPLGSQPTMQDQVHNPQANDPSAFKIPGL